MKRLIGLALLVASTLVLSATPAAAQRTGVLKGIVTDEQGGVLPGVSVTLTSAELMGIKATVTDVTGFYRFVSLPPGDYRIDAALQGFGSYVKNNLRVMDAGNDRPDDWVSVPLRDMRRAMVWALGEIGPDASEALPLIREWSKFYRVAWVSASAIAKIEGRPLPPTWR